MSMLSSFLHPERAYQAAQAAMQPYYQQAQGMLQPYQGFGQKGGEALGGMMERLMDPAALQAEWIGGYEESPVAQQARDQAMQSGLSAASSMGLMGSTPALQALQGGASNIALADRQNYLNDLMQKYLSGAQIGGQMMGAGATAAGQGAQAAMGMGENIGQLAYGQYAAPGNLLGRIGGGLTGLAGSALGGPIGGALANYINPNYGPWNTGGYYGS
jgi:hypothetical protein